MYWLNPHAACKLITAFEPSKSRFWNWVARRLWRGFNKEKGYFTQKTRNALPHIIEAYANNHYVLDLGGDVMGAIYGTKDIWVKRIYRENGEIRIVDGWGSLRGFGDGIYYDVIQPAIKDIQDIKNYRFPDITDDKHYEGIRKQRAKYPDNCIYSVSFGVQDLPATQIWEMSQFLMALVDYPEEMKAFQEKLTDHYIYAARRSIEAGADLIYLFEDYGYTDRTLISMDMWKEFTYPQLKRQVAAIHDAGGIVMLHSCGYQMPFLEYYVEAEVDILQSFQPKAGNDFKKAYEAYGDRMTFATGIDVQQGEFMTPQELRADIIRAYHTGGRKGRHILGMTHMLQHTMPLENIDALFSTVRQIQAGEHDA
jgi:uroporphyrinogen decarboxylase